MSPILSFFGLLLRVRTQKWNGLSFIWPLLTACLIAWVSHCAEPYLSEVADRSKFIWRLLLDTREQATATFVPGGTAGYIQGLAPDIASFFEIAFKMVGLILLFASAMRMGLSWAIQSQTVSAKRSAKHWAIFDIIGCFFACGGLGTQNLHLFSVAADLVSPFWVVVDLLDRASRSF